LEEATDFGNLKLARIIFNRIIQRLPKGTPIGIVYLAKRMFCSRRVVLYRDSETPKGIYKYVFKRNGWFMGDPMTKILLAISQ